MLSDEEKELVEEIQNGNKIGIYELIRTFKREGIENFITVRRKYIDIMINLIEKQSKEIEELKKQDLSNSKIIANMSERHFHDREKIRKYEALQDKIKAKIEEYDMKDLTICYGGRSLGRTFQQAVRTEVKNILQSLLEKE